MENTNIKTSQEEQISQEIESFKNELMDSIKDVPPATVLDNNNIENTNSSEDMEKKVAFQSLDSHTGISTTIDHVDMDKISEHQMDLLNADNTDEINLDSLSDILSGDEITEFTEVMEIGAMVQRRLHGEQFNPYNDFPEQFKKIVDSELAKNGLVSNNKNKSIIANFILNGIVEDYKKTSDGMDLDTMFASMEENLRKTTDGISKDIGVMFMAMDKDRNEALNNAIQKAEADGKTEAVEKLKAIKDSIDSAFNLEEFAEYCKTVRIKKFEVEKPQKVFDSFNQKYVSHKYSIGDISNAPLLLDLHLRDQHDDNVKYCIAFCKYCMNKNPDNISDHTFMYYFIRNISFIERLNPRGSVYNTMTVEERNFYDDYLYRIKTCINNINNR